MQTFIKSQSCEDRWPRDAIVRSRKTVLANNTIDFLAARLRADGFEEMAPGNSDGRRVFRSNRSGISIYFKNADCDHRLSGKAGVCEYTIAYEGEVHDSTQVQQIIIQCSKSTIVLKFLDLIEKDTRRVRERLEENYLKSLDSGTSIDVAQMGGFYRAAMRGRICKRLSMLCSKRLVPASYEGFVNAVTSNIEYWLSDECFSKKNDAPRKRGVIS